MAAQALRQVDRTQTRIDLNQFRPIGKTTPYTLPAPSKRSLLSWILRIIFGTFVYALIGFFLLAGFCLILDICILPLVVLENKYALNRWVILALAVAIAAYPSYRYWKWIVSFFQGNHGPDEMRGKNWLQKHTGVLREIIAELEQTPFYAAAGNTPLLGLGERWLFVPGHYPIPYCELQRVDEVDSGLLLHLATDQLLSIYIPGAIRSAEEQSDEAGAMSCDRLAWELRTRADTARRTPEAQKLKKFPLY